MLVDITDRKQIEVQLREAKEGAERANQSKDRFLAVLSHELRTPLTPVLMAVAALERDPGLRADVAEDLAMIKRNIELETKLIDDLLDVSRITSGKLPLSLEAVDLNEAVRQVCGICQSQLRERGIRLETESTMTRVCRRRCPRLQQVLWNVLKTPSSSRPRTARSA
jgi:signal transduction histidine kinase